MIGLCYVRDGATASVSPMLRRRLCFLNRDEVIGYNMQVINVR